MIKTIKKQISFENKTIVITDPCYIIKIDKESDWHECDYGLQMNILGISHYICCDNLYGDWGCTTYDENNNIIGEFCADAGMVGVFELDEILKYNPNFLEECHKYCRTIIENFTGIVKFVIYDYDILQVEGEGNINFYSKQTSL